MHTPVNPPEALERQTDAPDEAYSKGDLLTGEELHAYLERFGLKAELELYSSASTLRINRTYRSTERYRLGTFSCGVRWQRVS